MRKRKHIMVCVTQQKSCRRLIEAGSQLRRGPHDELHVVHVYKENWKYFGQLQEADALEYLYEASRDYGAELSVFRASDIEESLKTYIQKHKIDTVVMGESLEPTAQQNMILRMQAKGIREVRWEIVPLDGLLDEAK